MIANTDDPRLDELLLRWEELHEQGQSLSAAELCSTCPELAGELARRIALLRQMDPLLGEMNTDPDAPAPAAPAGGSSRVSATARADFRDLRFHAAGGLGEVFMARNAELNREVALKFLKPERSRDPDSLRRFLQEAEVTGRLEHPGIVPIYALGTDGSGAPCYAMRFIRGQTLQDPIDAFHAAEKSSRDRSERSLALRELLNRFVSICSTMAYAHSRGILHRDLKPRNVMLGKYDETLVVDWGLAKAFDRDESARSVGEERLMPSSGSGSGSDTPTVGVVGTPAYMSPEQAEAKWELVGPASDIFGLGAILYAILTGRAPYQGRTIRAILEKVKRCEFPVPRQIKPGVSRALEAVCLNAMAATPEDRYATALDLAADIRRWLADEPVSAYAEPLTVRTRRWARRNRTAVTGAVATLIVGLVGLGAVAVVQSQANSALEAKNLQLTQANAATTKAKNEAEAALDEATQAKRATQEALAQSEESRQRAEAVLSFLKDDVLAATRPEGQEGGLGKDVTVRKAMDAAELRIAGAFKDQPAVEAEVRDTLGETYAYLGEAPLAIRQHERALELRRAKLGPDHPDTLMSYNNLASAYADAGRTAEAIKLHEVTLTLRESKLGPDHPDTLTSRGNLSIAYESAGRTAEAITLDEGTLKLRESRLGPDHPDTLMSRNNLAASYLTAGRTVEAIKLHEATLRLQESKLGPDHPDTLTSRSNLAVAYWSAGDTAQAIKLHEETLKLRESKLELDHPDTLQSRNGLATAYLAAGRAAEAIKLFEETLKLRESKLELDHPNTLSSRSNLAAAYLAAGRTAEAIKLFEETLKLRESKLGPDHPDTLMSRNNLAVAYESLGRWTDAEALRRGALARRRNSEKPDSPLLGGDLAGLGRNLLNQEKCSAAEPLLRESLAIRAKAVPDDWSRFHSMSQLGWSLLGQGRYTEAEPLIVQGYEGMKAREAKITAWGKPHLAEAAVRVVRLYGAWGKPEQAAAWKSKLGLTDLPADVFARP